MAMSYTESKKTVLGDLQCSFYNVVMTGVTSASFKTGYSNILIAHHNNETTTAAGKVLRNIASDGTTTEYGTVYLTGFTSGDSVTIQVIAV